MISRSPRLMTLALTVALAATWACGGSARASSDSAGSDTGSPKSNAGCSITLSGAQTGSFACSDDLTAILGISTNQSMVGFSSTSTAPSILVAIKFSGPPATRTYRSSDPGAAQGLTVRNGAATWLAEGATETDAGGSYVLTLSSVKEVPFASDAKSYDVHGKLTATLEPDRSTGATGTVTLNATF